MKQEYEIFLFNQSQVTALTVLDKIRLLRITKMGTMRHPITDKTHAVVVYYESYKFVEKIVNKLEDRLLNDHGRKNLQIMVDTKQIEIV